MITRTILCTPSPPISLTNAMDVSLQHTDLGIQMVGETEVVVVEKVSAPGVVARSPVVPTSKGGAFVRFQFVHADWVGAVLLLVPVEGCVLCIRMRRLEDGDCNGEELLHFGDCGDVGLCRRYLDDGSEVVVGME